MLTWTSTLNLKRTIWPFLPLEKIEINKQVSWNYLVCTKELSTFCQMVAVQTRREGSVGSLITLLALCPTTTTFQLFKRMLALLTDSEKYYLVSSLSARWNSAISVNQLSLTENTRRGCKHHQLINLYWYIAKPKYMHIYIHMYCCCYTSYSL